MKKLSLVIALAGVLAVPTLQAGLATTGTITPWNDTTLYSSGNGGEFRAVVDSGLQWVLANYAPTTRNAPGNQGSGGFQTFCIETSEQFNPGTTYSVSFSDRALYNNNPPSGYDIVSRGTGFLYSQFARGTLVGYDYNYNGDTYGGLGGNRTGSAGDLQKAIWALEGETGGSVASWIATLLQGEFGTGTTIATWKLDGVGNNYGVRAMNLMHVNDNTIQDMLVVVPEPATVLAGALLLLPFAASTIRRFRKS